MNDPTSAAVGEPADPTGLRRFVFGDRPIDEWPPPGADADGEPWQSFVAARDAHRAGDLPTAVSRWRAIASMPDVESRQVLQAWHLLRQAGEAPPPDQAKVALGAVAEVAVPGGHDLLAAYADGSVRYLNVSGAAVVVDTPIASLEPARRQLLEVARQVADAIGPWEGPQLPPLPAGHTRLTILTPSGPHLGQGPDELFRGDPLAEPFLSAATSLLVDVTDLRSDPPPA